MNPVRNNIGFSLMIVSHVNVWNFANSTYTTGKTFRYHWIKFFITRRTKQVVNISN